MKAEKTVKIELDLTAEQYQQLVECYFAGSLILEDLYPSMPNPDDNLVMHTKINSHASMFGREDLVNKCDGVLEGICLVSREVEERIIPFIFGEG